MGYLENSLYLEVRQTIGRSKLLDLKEQFLIESNYFNDPIQNYTDLVSSIESSIKKHKLK